MAHVESNDPEEQLNNFRYCLQGCMEKKMREAIKALEDFEEMEIAGRKLGFSYYKFITDAKEYIEECVRRGSVDQTSLSLHEMTAKFRDLPPHQQEWFTGPRY
jgi:hypothetical protein